MIFSVIVASQPHVPHARTLQIEDSRRISTIPELALSPDGKLVAYVVSTPDYTNASYVVKLHLMDVASGRAMVVKQNAGIGAPHWSPDGTKLGFVAADTGGRAQVFVRDGDGKVAQITHAGGDVSDFSWRPDGRVIAFAAADAPSARGHHTVFKVGDNDYTLKAPVPPVHLWTIAVAGGSAKRITAGGWTIPATSPGSLSTSQFTWSRDGRSIYYTRLETTESGKSEESTIHVMDLASGQTRKLTHNDAFELTPVVSPNGSYIAYSYPQNGDYLAQNQLHIIGRDGDTIVSRAIDRDIAGARWLPDGRSLLVSAPDRGGTSVWRVGIDGRAQKLDFGELQPEYSTPSLDEFDSGIAIDVAKTGAVAFIADTPTRADELYFKPTLDSKARRLTNVNGFLDDVTLSRRRLFTFTGPQGQSETSIVTDPPVMQPGTKYPIVVLLHGGPAENKSTVFEYNGFWALAEEIAARGYVVFEPNYRGSDDSGNAHMIAIEKDTVAGPASDILAGLAAVKQLPEVDGSRVGVSGWSYGGLLTSWLITQSHEWKAAVSGAAVNDEVESYTLSESGVQNRYYLGTSPFSLGGMDIYRTQSPLTYAADVTTPTLIWSTTGDPVVPTTMSYAFFHALRENPHHPPVTFMQFVATSHGPSDPVDAEDLLHLWIDWFDRYLK